VSEPKGISLGPVFAFSQKHGEVARFYREVVGLVGDPSDDSTWFEAANAKLVVHEPEERQTPPEVSGQPGFVVWFGVQDIRAVWDRAHVAGAAVGAFHGDYFFARDPDGRYVGFFLEQEHAEAHAHGHDHEH